MVMSITTTFSKENSYLVINKYFESCGTDKINDFFYSFGFTQDFTKNFDYSFVETKGIFK